jgi:hypothetical protein
MPPLSSKQTTFQSTVPGCAGEADTVSTICEGLWKVPLVYATAYSPLAFPVTTRLAGAAGVVPPTFVAVAIVPAAAIRAGPKTASPTGVAACAALAAIAVCAKALAAAVALAVGTDAG